jgi:hypothetical protein
VYFQRFSLTCRYSTRHNRDMKRAGRGDFAEIKAAAASRVDALNGDTRRLEARLRQEPTAEECELAADILAGKIKPCPGRGVRDRDAMIAWFVRVARRESGWQMKEIVDEVKKHYRVARTTLFDILKKQDGTKSG